MPKSSRVGLFTIESKKGESLESIAEKNGIRWRQLASFNPKLKKLKSGRLAVGQVLLIPTPAVASASLAVPDPSIERFPNSTARLRVHTVRRGETLGGIARKYSTTPEHLMRINGMRRAMIFPGQTILLNGPSRKPRAEGSRKPTSRSSSKARSTSSRGSKSKRAAKKSSATAGKSRKHSGAG
jgi:LysM repeat protein